MRLIQAVDRMRAGLARLHRSSAPGNIALLELATGAWTTQVPYVAAKLGVADRLASEPAHAGDVAAPVGADPDALPADACADESRGAASTPRRQVRADSGR